MAQGTQADLLDYLAKRYEKLKGSLSRLLGNDDQASDALHDAWVRLHEREDVGDVRNPSAYLKRMATNIAVDAHRRDSKLLSGDEVELLLDSLMDPTPGPEHIAAARADFAILDSLMDRMPKRRQQVAYLVHYEGMELRAVAERLNISERTVAYELKHIQQAARDAFGLGKK